MGIIIALLHPNDLASRQPEYLAQHRLLAFLGKRICHFIHNFHPKLITHLGLPDSNGQHDKLVHYMQQMILRRIQPLQSRSNREAITLFSRLDIGHADFVGQQFVYSKLFKGVHKETRMDHVFVILPWPFYDVGGRRHQGEFDLALDSGWYCRVALLFKMTVRTDSNQLRAWSVP